LGVVLVLFWCIAASNAESAPCEERWSYLGVVIVSLAMAGVFAAAMWVAVTCAGAEARSFALGTFLLSLAMAVSTAAVGMRRRAKTRTRG
jgi:hypothetical protein